MKYFKKVEGKNVYLSPMNTEDYELYTKWMNDHKVTDFLSNTSRVYTLESEKKWLEDMVLGNNVSFAIVKSENDELLGNIALHNPNYIDGIAELGIFLGEEENKSKGYGSEAIKLLLGFAFNTLNMNNVMLRYFSFNKRAKKCYEKCGFKEFGVRHNAKHINNEFYDEVYMEVTREEYYKNN